MKRAVKILFAATVSALLAVGGAVVATGAEAAEPDPVFGVPVFNDPVGSEAAQYAIFQQLARLIDRVPAGETIEMSWFEFKTPDYADTAARPNITDRLIKAHRRGVNVRILLDGKVTDGSSNATQPPYLRLKPELGTNETASSYILLCAKNKGCIGKRKIGDADAYNHNKFLTATKVVLNNGAVKTGVVFQSSGNLGTWDADTAYNNAITWTEASSYANYKAYFNDLKKYRTSSTGDDNYYRVGASADQYKTHFFPRKETNEDVNQASTDTIVNILDSVKCSYVGQTDGKPHQTDIRIVMWALTRTAVTKKLADLVKDGCWVDVVYSTTSTSALHALQDVGNREIGITSCGVQYDNRTIKAHSKYMLIDGAYDDDQIPRVFMGSHNYSITALRNADESMVRIRDASVHGAYLHSNFYKVRDFCRTNTSAAAAATTVLSDEAALRFDEG
ncbi:phosphatidylserine/phosphatidylglycerophosphate/cardiolipin synthase family protein [Actinoplanes sp. NPDC049681]|uniref:phosphatidylserine/phosphatidylglycerophosphate/ cardiolipin synthase family protein n=1 Tax=Actinoplanes sp. NPDC049681 TaxID=3363905 RepID=UPI0037B4A74F